LFLMLFSFGVCAETSEEPEPVTEEAEEVAEEKKEESETVEEPINPGEETETEKEESKPVQEEKNLIRVGLYFGKTSKSELEVTTSQAFLLPGDLAPYHKINFYYVYENGGMKVTDSDGNVLGEFREGENCRIYAQSGSFTVDKKTYRYSFEVTAEKGGLKLVNVLPLDWYLYGVLPNEIYPSWGEEALKATAVAARSFTLASVSGKHSSDGFDVCTNTHCQMYKGMSSEQKSTNDAVDATSGQVITYNNKIVSAMYNANNGGYTEATENIWVAKLPYYVAKPDPYTPEDKWTVSFTPAEVEALLAKKNVDIGEVRRIEVEGYAESGRAMKLTIVGSKGEYSLTKDSIRSLFGLRSTLFTLHISGGASKSLAAALKTMEKNSGMNVAIAYLVDPEVKFIFNGRGYGHGAGISQWGCKQMADMVKTYTEIIYSHSDGNKFKTLDELK